MAVVFIDPRNNALAYRISHEDERRQPLPEGTTTLVRFDERNNATVLRDLQRYTPQYSIVSGMLRRNGVAVAIAAPSEAYQDAQRVSTLGVLIDRLRRPMPPLTPDEIRQALLTLALLTRHTLREAREKVD